MKVAIIAAAGISARFNKGIPEEEKKLKVIYYDENPKQTLLYNLINKCSYADRIIVVGGYKYDDLKNYLDDESIIEKNVRGRITLVKNDHYEDLASGYSFYLGLCEAFDANTETGENSDNLPDEVIFVEGDLDVDSSSFNRIKTSDGSVLTYNFNPIYANKAVVLYRDGEGKYQYAFNSSHGLLRIDAPFSVILNSGQIWKFHDVGSLLSATLKFGKGKKDGTNLEIIQEYINQIDDKDISLISIERWTNCNTREDYGMIKNYWNMEG